MPIRAFWQAARNGALLFSNGQVIHISTAPTTTVYNHFYKNIYKKIIVVIKKGCGYVDNFAWKKTWLEKSTNLFLLDP